MNIKLLNLIRKDSIFKLYELLSEVQKRKVFFLIFIILATSGLELLGLGLILPAINFLVDPNYLDEISQNDLVKILFFDPSKEMIILFGILFIILLYLIKSLFLSYFIHWQNKFAADFQVYLSENLYLKYLKKDFQFHTKNNSSNLIRNINKLIPNVYSSLIAVMTLLMETVIILSIIILLLKIETIGTISIITLGSIIGFIFSKFYKTRIVVWGEKKVFFQGKSIQSVMEGLGGIKTVKILGKEIEFLKKFTKNLKRHTNYERLNTTFQQLPRIWLEFFAILSLGILIFSILFQEKNFETIIPIIAIFTGAAFKLIPSTSKILSSIQTLGFNQNAVNIIFDGIKSPSENNHNYNYKKNSINNINNIKIRDISFKYDETNYPVIKNLSFEINKGNTIGIIGKTGSGKSTMIDILLGLLKPKTGQILIDKIDIHKNAGQLELWQRNIGYVPQDIFLMDDTILNNIIFSFNPTKVDIQALNSSLKSAQLEDFINSLPNGIQTMVGERGVRLSGGQVQRIGIARALYHNPSILIFDEATSSLDYDTEEAIVNCIEKLQNKTKIIVAHRLSTVENCDYIIRLKNGSIEKIGKPKDFIKKFMKN